MVGFVSEPGSAAAEQERMPDMPATSLPEGPGVCPEAAKGPSLSMRQGAWSSALEEAFADPTRGFCFRQTGDDGPVGSTMGSCRRRQEHRLFTWPSAAHTWLRPRLWSLNCFSQTLQDGERALLLLTSVISS